MAIGELWTALGIRQTEILNTKGANIVRLESLAGDMIAKVIAPKNLVGVLRDRLLYQIVPTAIVVTIASAFVNVGTFFSYFKSAPAVDTNETCTKALTDCQNGSAMTKERLEICKNAIPTLQARRDEVKADWKACLDKLETCQNSTHGTLANCSDLSKLDASTESGSNSIVYTPWIISGVSTLCAWKMFRGDWISHRTTQRIRNAFC